MRRFLLRLWLCSSALGALLLVGCASRGPLVRQAPLPVRTAKRADEQGLGGGAVPSSYRMRSAVAALGAPTYLPPKVCKVEWRVRQAPRAFVPARLEQPVPAPAPAQLAGPIRFVAPALGPPRPSGQT